MTPFEFLPPPSPLSAPLTPPSFSPPNALFPFSSAAPPKDLNFPSMAASPSLTNLHLQDPDQESPLIPKKTHNLSLRNFVLIVLVLAVLPLFPSQAPEFINETPFTKVWELLYLLFIGIVVCYGLFSKRAVKVNTEAYPNLGNINPQFWSPLTGICQISSIFENGFDESKIPQIFSPFPKGLYSNGCSVVDGGGNFGSLGCDDRFGNYSGSNGKKVSRGLNLKDFVGESTVLDQIGKPKSSVEYKPLGLPIRSLRSSKLDTDGVESSNVSGSCNGGERVENGGARGLVPMNLEGKFKDEEAAPSPIPWRSRSVRMGMRQEMSNIKSPSHVRPTSVGDFESERLKSQSLRSSIPSHTSSKHSSSGVSSFASIPAELPKPKMEDLKGKEKFDGSRAPTLQPKLAPLSGDSLTRSSNTRHFSIGSTSEMKVQIGSKDDIKDLRKSKKDVLASKQETLVNAHSKGKLPNAKMQDLKGKEKFNGPRLQPKQLSLNALNGDATFKSSNSRSLSMGSSSEVKVNGVENYLKDFLDSKGDNVLGRANTMDFSKLSQKPTALVNGYTPGKSVRTVRSSEKVVDAKETGNVFASSIDDMFGMKLEEGAGLENMPTDTRKGKLDDVTEIKFDSFRMSSDKEEEAGSDMFSDAEPHSGEVDRRADEFIAKFREQIRLQKVATRRLNFW